MKYDEMTKEEVFDKICKLIEEKPIDLKMVRKYLERFEPWDEQHSFEYLFSQAAYYIESEELFNLLYEYCSNPDYSSNYMFEDVFFASQYNWSNPHGLDYYALTKDEREVIVQKGMIKIHILHKLLSHPEAVEEYRHRTGDELLIQYVAYKFFESNLDNDIDIFQLKRVFIELVGFHVYDDYGPTILKEFNLDRLDEYKLSFSGIGGRWEIYDYDNKLVAVF